MHSSNLSIISTYKTPHPLQLLKTKVPGNRKQNDMSRFQNIFDKEILLMNDYEELFEIYLPEGLIYKELENINE
jgi:hypothetical protein